MGRKKLTDFLDFRTGEFTEKKTDLLIQFGTIVDALLYSELFLPKLIEIDGSVILANSVNDAPKQFRLAKLNRQKPLLEIEKAFNWVELGYLFAPEAEGNDQIELELAYLVVEAWKGRLEVLFPEKTFHVYVLLPSETGSVVGVGFHELRS